VNTSSQGTMKQNFIFVIILLTTLFTVNTRATTFNKCPDDTPQLSVTITPDPLAAGDFGSFNISGTLDNDITSTTQLVIMFTDTNRNPLVPLYIQHFQNISGQQVNIIVQVPTPATFPTDYSIAVIIGNPTNSQSEPLNVYGCAYATIGQAVDMSSISDAVEASYPIADSNAPY
jgi:hypothetical protein